VASVELRNVWKIYQQRGNSVEAVRDINLECRDGEFLAILGPSGCGKSSTMRMIAGLEAISRGDILIGDRVVNNVKPGERDVAMVFENYALYPHLSVRDNITLSLQVKGLGKDEIRRRLDRAVATLDIGDILNRKPGALSGGQKQRVAIARAIVRDPAVFIMDEPISHIDARLRAKVRAELKHLLFDLNATTIYVTHNQAEALSMADRIAVMSHGELQQVGTADEVYRHPANLFVADFVGEPPINQMPCLIERDGGLTRIRAGELVVDQPGQAGERFGRVNGNDGFVLGIRPSDLRLRSEPVAGVVGTGRVDLVELLGDEQIVTVQVGDQRVQSVMDLSLRASPGDSVWLEISPDRLHLFDKETGRSLAA
jgi:multiple sugar transport system ATP-binding protein